MLLKPLSADRCIIKELHCHFNVILNVNSIFDSKSLHVSQTACDILPVFEPVLIKNKYCWLVNMSYYYYFKMSQTCD